MTPAMFGGLVDDWPSQVPKQLGNGLDGSAV